ncbi:MAG: DUF2961 domain-containing protein [Verrucomicrobia bacterium]|nr:DUF2961 domain-containing protein [Verrucomicrobiota bacterium]
MVRTKLLPRLQSPLGNKSQTAALAIILLAVASGYAQPAPNAPGAVNPSENPLVALTQLSTAQTRRVSSTSADLNSNGDSRVIKEGQTLVLAELTGPGAITHIWNTIAAQDPFAGRSLVLRIYWDGMDKPSVESPLGDFFGIGHGAVANFHSLPVSVSSYGRSRTCFWRMPFRKSAKITLTNEARGYGDVEVYYYVDWEKLPSLPEDALYFHARYNQAFPATAGDYPILETKGRGNYVGTVYSVHQVKIGWFGEGDDHFYIDGETKPSLCGTGTEDYFNDSWGFRPFVAPAHGVTLYEGVFAGDRVSAYRWHLSDPVRFGSALKVSIEHKGSRFNDAGVKQSSSNERPDWVSSVAFWYQTPPVADQAPLPPATNRVAPYRVLQAKNLTFRADPPATVKQEEEGLIYTPGKPEAQIEFDFEVTEPGRYQVAAVLILSLSSARYQPMLDGQPVGPELDLCVLEEDWTWFSFDLHDLKPGKHTLKFVGRGASPHQRTKAPPRFGFGLNSLILLRLEDMAGYK